MPIPESTRQISEVSWEIPTTFKPGMNVPARVYASRKLLEGMDDGVFEQLTNVACLPGIVRHAYAMADAHWGYGFPIGGVAAFEPENGVISPGGIGFDINCLHPDSKVYDGDGTWTKISELDARTQGFITYDPSGGRLRRTKSILKESRWESGALVKIRTKAGKTLLATADHPVQTRRGMVPAGDLSLEDQVVSSGFTGYPRSSPAGIELVSAETLNQAMDKMGITGAGNARGLVMNQLRRRGLDRILLNDPKVSQLLKLLGFIFGDASIPRVKKGQYVSFFGKAEDLLDIKLDLAEIGFESHSYSRQRHHRMNTKYGTSEFDFKEDSLYSSSTAFAVLMVALGAPYGKKASVEYRLPRWLFASEDWQKRLFLAAYFGAELSTPTTVNGYDFQMLLFSVNKLATLEANAKELVADFTALLGSLGIESTEPTRVEGYDYAGVDGLSIGVRAGVLSNVKNLLGFLSKVGYLYNRGKQRIASLAVSFIVHNESIREERNAVRLKAIQTYAAGVGASKTVESLSTPTAGPSFIRHSIWSSRGKARVWQSTKFEQYCSEREAGKTGLIFDSIDSLESVPYEGQVYDVTIGDPEHNFISDGIVVSNCGMRLISTSLRYSEVRPKVKELVDLMFRLVPAGVGVKGTLRITESQFDEVMRYGVKWCAENGLAWKDDPGHVEEGGFIKGADPSKVSRQARSRGIDQLGTLGSGNHYLEIQVVDPARHFDKDLGQKFGIVHDDQVLVMVHCGSRGFGHQIGSDYLRVFDGAMRKYGLAVRDRELACAPFSSKEGQDYYGAMVCAANMAFTNRQIIVQKVRDAFSQVFHRDAESMEMRLVYDVCHNVAKVERHTYDGTTKELLVHRKGATRSFGPGHPDIPSPYRSIGQPVIIGGSMETGSYLLVGTAKAMEDTFGSTAHGSGRTMSRTAAKRTVRGADLQRKMLERGIYVKAATMDGLAEEAGMAYKDISEVVETMDRAGISKKVVALRPVGNIKG
ncbi:MAG: RtcB family protein [Thaumarchaeota archaeon]|nr:RtcB family protein [Nitrososphaerota archaeon]